MRSVRDSERLVAPFRLRGRDVEYEVEFPDTLADPRSLGDPAVLSGRVAGPAGVQVFFGDFHLAAHGLLFARVDAVCQSVLDEDLGVAAFSDGGKNRGGNVIANESAE